MLRSFFESPIGTIEVKGTETEVVSVKFVQEYGNDLKDSLNESEVDKCIKQLSKFFASELEKFDLNLRMNGTEFQKEVWKEVLKVPFGTTVSYLDISKKLGDKNKTRAVGNANGLNELLIIVPCHRIIGANGSLTGYVGGLDKKKWLLDFENKLTSNQTRLEF